MYDPGSYMSMETMQEVVSEFDWPAEYVLEDELPDGIVLAFPKSNFFFVEGFESEVEVRFFSEDTGVDTPLNLKHALGILIPQERKGQDLKDLGIDENLPPRASADKVRAGIRNACILIQTYLMPVVDGDFSWVSQYQQSRVEK